MIVGDIDESSGNAQVLGAIAIADVLRADAASVVQQLKTNGIERVVMLTGDNTRVATPLRSRRGWTNSMRTCFPKTRCVSLRN